MVDTGSNSEAAHLDVAVSGGSRVLIYAMNYAPEITGCGKYTGEIGAHLRGKGVDVEVVTTPPHYPGWAMRDGARNRYSVERTDRMTVRRCPLWLSEQMSGIKRLLAPFTFALTSAPVAIGRVLFGRPDAVYCVEPTLLAAPAVLLAAKLVGARTVLHVQDLEVDAAFTVGHLAEHGLLRRAAEAFERMCLKAFDHVVTISDQMAARLSDKGVAEDRLSIVRNWVDLNHIRPVERSKTYRAEIGVAEDAFVALYSGNLGRKQGLDLVIEAARALESDPRIVFVIAGEGPEKAGLEAAAADLGNVRFLPLQPWERLGEFLGLCDIHLLPQQANTGDLVLPSKVGGMLASGRPIVAAADEGSELEHFLHDAAVIVPPGDVAAFAAAIRAEADGGVTRAETAQNLARQLSAPVALGRILERLLPHRIAGSRG